MENQNLFKKAIHDNKLLEFAIGKGGFFLKDPEYDEHWILGTWTHYVLPFCEANTGCEQSILDMFTLLIEDDFLRADEKIEKLLYHLYVFYYLRDEGRFEINDIVKGIGKKVIAKIEEYRIKLDSEKNNLKLNELRNSISLIKKRGGLQDYDLTL